MKFNPFDQFLCPVFIFRPRIGGIQRIFAGIWRRIWFWTGTRLFSRNEIQILNGLNTTYKVFYFKIYYETISKPRSKKKLTRKKWEKAMTWWFSNSTFKSKLSDLQSLVLLSFDVFLCFNAFDQFLSPVFIFRPRIGGIRRIFAGIWGISWFRTGILSFFRWFFLLIIFSVSSAFFNFDFFGGWG